MYIEVLCMHVNVSNITVILVVNICCSCNFKHLINVVYTANYPCPFYTIRNVIRSILLRYFVSIAM